MKKKVAIFGATGVVGQRLLAALENHPWFEVVALAASDRSTGKRYEEATAWRLPGCLPAGVASLEVLPVTSQPDCDLILSSLPAEIAADVEEDLADKGFPVISNSSPHRMDADVPLLIPEVNHSHLRLLPAQRRRRGGSGYIVTNPNCSTIGLAMALAPLQKVCGIASVVVVTLQAVSGAGYPGVPSLDILDNIIPYIGGEEEKMERETQKILGRFDKTGFRHAEFRISAHCNRVPVLDGHLENASVELGKRVPAGRLIEAWRTFRGRPQELDLPSAPANPILYLEADDRPQPRLDRDAENGMSVTVGRLRTCGVLSYKFTLLSHNTIRGAAGATLLNAELLKAEGYL